MDTDVFRDEESGMERKTEKEVWQGLMLTCKVGHSFPIGFAIAPRGKIDGLLRYADVKTGNETFDKRFTVKTDNGDAALLTLTPRMQEKILAAASVSPGPLFVTFCQDGRVSAAVRTTGRNFFVPEKAGAEGARARLTENLRKILAIVDEANPSPPRPRRKEKRNMPLWLACVLLLVLDLAALVYFRRHLRQKKTMHVIATCVCGLLAALLLLYLALAAMLLFAASQN